VHSVVRADSLAACAVTDDEYPRLQAFYFLSDMLAAFEKSESKWAGISQDQAKEPEYMTKALSAWQKPPEDKLAKTQRKIEEVKDLMQQAIDQVLKNGETIDNLMQKSADLSEQSKKFHKNSKKLNPCCKI
jgi:synaptobrevin homolog YKT6